MYFNDNRKDTNIDSEFKDNKNNLSNILNLLNKYKLFIIIGVVLLLIIIMIILFATRKPTKVESFLELLGEETISIYQGNDYIEPGYTAYNSKEEDLTSKVQITSNLNINIIGSYEITYTLDDITKTRKINVIEKNKEYTYIKLNAINKDINIYLKLGDKYVEPGYQVFNSEGKDLNNLVKVTGTVDTNKKGTYKIVYSLVDPNNVTISKARIVTVMDSEISLSLKDSSYTNGNAVINVHVADEFFDYMILPNNEKITTSTYSYEVSNNGKYTFTTYNSKGMKKESSIEVKNIDRTVPMGSCTIDENNKGSIIIINTTDKSGIQKFVYNNQIYTNSTINLSRYITNATITVYDNANNQTNITCKIEPKVYISDIKQDGVIITVNAKKINNEITGYYFSYDDKRPNKTTGGYIATNKNSIDVVRLPGTTYVWVEDKSGKISSPQTITLTNDVLFTTTGSKYKLLQGTKLSTYLSNNGWSIDEFEKLIARSARAAGLYTKEAAATSAIALPMVLAQKYKIKIPYWWGGKSWRIGVENTWGTYKTVQHNNNTYKYYGLDCSGFVTWSYVNAGYKIPSGTYPHKYYWGKYSGMKVNINKNNGEPGDWLAKDGHVKMIVAKTDTGYIAAEAKGGDSGLIISTQSYSKPGEYKVIIADKFLTAYQNKKYSQSEYPTGF